MSGSYELDVPSSSRTFRIVRSFSRLAGGCSDGRMHYIDLLEILITIETTVFDDPFEKFAEDGLKEYFKSRPFTSISPSVNTAPSL